MKAALHGFVVLLGCSSAAWAQDWPTSDGLAQLIGEELPEGLGVGVVDIRAEENAGSLVAPEILQRLVVDVIAMEDLFVPSGEIGGRAVFELASPPLAQIKLFGLARSTLSREEWITEFTWENPEEVGAAGIGRAALPARALLAGSAEHVALLEELDGALNALVGTWSGPMGCQSLAEGALRISRTPEEGTPDGAPLEGVLSYQEADGSSHATYMTIHLVGNQGGLEGRGDLPPYGRDGDFGVTFGYDPAIGFTGRWVREDLTATFDAFRCAPTRLTRVSEPGVDGPVE